jgi:hypothetical protein
MSSADEEDLYNLFYDLDDYNNINNQTIDVVANAYLEEIHKMNQINQIVTNQMENSNNDSELIMHQKIIEENNEKIKEYTETYNKIREITDINKIREITETYNEFLNDKDKIYLYFIKFIVNDYKLLTPRNKRKDNSAKNKDNSPKKQKLGGKKSKKIMKSKKSKSKKYIKSK